VTGMTRSKARTGLIEAWGATAVVADALDPEAVARAVVAGEVERGVVVCGSGVGASIAANKVPGIYAALCHDTYSAHQGVEHDNMNVLCLGCRVIGPALAEEIVTAYVGARFQVEEERHVRRHRKVLAIEQAGIGAPRS